MSIPPEISVPVGLAAAGAVVTWVRSVEVRLNLNEAVISKIDQLVSLLLEDRIGKH